MQISQISHITQRQLQIPNIEPGAINFPFLQMRESRLPHDPTITLRVSARANDQIFWHTLEYPIPSERQTVVA